MKMVARSLLLIAVLSVVGWTEGCKNSDDPFNLAITVTVNYTNNTAGAITFRVNYFENDASNHNSSSIDVSGNGGTNTQVITNVLKSSVMIIQEYVALTNTWVAKTTFNVGNEDMTRDYTRN